MQVKSYQDLIAWQKAISLVTEIYRLTAQFPGHEIYGLTSQLRRASVSIPSNLRIGLVHRQRLVDQLVLGRAEAALRESHALGQRAEHAHRSEERRVGKECRSRW